MKVAGSSSSRVWILVRSSGFEPPRYCYRQPLKLVRLPVPPRPHVVDKDSLTATEKACKPG